MKKLVGVKGAQRFRYVVLQLKNFLVLDGEVEERLLKIFSMGFMML